ncbi:MAG: hypothetical protein JO144_09360 [Actinobacteria bacterium]|nr:hypothetical protein [Actinomycetota bacterium]
MAASLFTPAAGATAGPAIDNSSLMNGGMACSTSTPPVLGYFASQLEVLGTDPAPTSDSRYQFTFAIWPQSDPTAITTFSTTNYSIDRLARGQVPAGTLNSGSTYSWHAQLSDTNGTSPWSQTCTFSYDATPPGQPAISSSNYPLDGSAPGPVGQLARFTLDGSGHPDTAGFAWTWGDDLPVPGCAYSGPQGQLVCPDPLSVPGTVRADQPGGTAGLVLNPPHDGPVDLTIAAVDRAGNESSHVTYRIFVPYSGPVVTVISPQPTCGSKATVSFAPNPGVSGVVSYTYTLQDMNGEPPVTVRANRSGQATATIDVSSQPYAVSATSLSANGFRSSVGYASLDVNPQPTVSSDVYGNSGQPAGGVGVPGTFTFSPPYDGHQVSGYRYQLPNGPARTVAADPNTQTATVPFIPTRAGSQTLTVQSINGDAPGGSCQASYTFVVAGTPR